MSLLAMQVRYISESKLETFLVSSLEKELTLYFANLKSTLAPLVVCIKLFRKIIKQLFSLMTISFSE